MLGSIDNQLTAKGAHFAGGLAVAYGVSVLAKKVKEYFFASTKESISQHAIPGVGFVAGVATSVAIASSPTLQKIALHALIGGIAGSSAASVVSQTQLQMQQAVEAAGPLFSSLSSILCGAAGAAVGSWVNT